MPNLNKVLLMGNLTRDPELRVTPKGTPICQFSLAINRTWSDGAGEKQEEVIFVDVEAWGKQGETIAKYCTKGRPLYVEGRLRLDQWEDKNTKEKRSRMKVVLEQFQFLGEGRSSGGAAQGAAPEERAPERQSSPPPRSAPPSRSKMSQTELDEDVPF
jgi:single-strand DNA-binding protein